MTLFWADPMFWLYLAAWVPYTAFVLLYAARSPWYRSGLGRSLMLSKTVIAVLLTHAVTTAVFGRRYPGHELVLLLLVAGITASGWYQLLMLLRLQRKDHRGAERGEPSGPRNGDPVPRA